MAIARQLAALGALARANLDPFERPDRMIAGVAAALPWGATTTAAFALAVERDPRRAAIVDPDGAVTYRQMWRRSEGVAAGLRQAGAAPGVTVGVLARNDRSFVDALLGASKTGADIVLLNTGFAGPQLADVVAAEGVSIVVHDGSFAEQAADLDGAAVVDGDALAGHGHQRRPHHAGAPPGPRRHPHQWHHRPPEGRHEGRRRRERAGGCGRHPRTDPVPPARRPGRAVAAVPRLGPVPPDVRLHPLRDHRDRAALRPGGDAAQHRRRARPRADRRAGDAAADARRRHRALETPIDTGSLQVIASSGSALGGQLAVALQERFGPVVYNTYGSTEVAVASIATPADLRRHPTTVGKVAPGASVEILGHDDEPLPAGMPGRIFVGNGARFEGYTDGGTKEQRRGLLSSGDVGHFDADGYLFVDGRDDDMIISGGENLFPSEVEELLNHHPKIHEAAVVGVPDDEFGQVLAAFVVKQPRARLSARAGAGPRPRAPRPVQGAQDRDVPRRAAAQSPPARSSSANW